MSDLTQAQETQLLTEAGWPAAEIPTAMGVIGAESSGNPDVVDWGSGKTALADSQGWPPPANAAGYDEAAVGVFQDLISPASAVTEGSVQALQNPYTNATVALEKYEAGGWAPWESDTYVKAHPQLLDEAPVPATAPSGTDAQLTSFWGDIEKGLEDSTAGGVAGLVDGGNASVGLPSAQGALSGLASGWQGFVLTAIGAIAGIGLVILGVYKASGGKNGHPVLDKAAQAAALA